MDSDDEEGMMMKPQPYDTTRSIGFTDYLNHLSTKFIARRSDILVSSTLSITLTPIDDEFEPAHFATIENEEVWKYVMLRSEYRASQVKSNLLPNPKKRK